MSRAESRYGRGGRYGGTRFGAGPTEEYAEDLGPDENIDHDPEEDFSDEYGRTHSTDDQDGPDLRQGRGPGRGRRGHRGRRPGQENRRGVGKVSAFSASAIKRVSVLGERPNQIVYTLAEQSKRKRGTAAARTPT